MFIRRIWNEAFSAPYLTGRTVRIERRSSREGVYAVTNVSKNIVAATISTAIDGGPSDESPTNTPTAVVRLEFDRGAKDEELDRDVHKSPPSKVPPRLPSSASVLSADRSSATSTVRIVVSGVKFTGDTHEEKGERKLLVHTHDSVNSIPPPIISPSLPQSYNRP